MHVVYFVDIQKCIDMHKLFNGIVWNTMKMYDVEMRHIHSFRQKFSVSKVIWWILMIFSFFAHSIDLIPIGNFKEKLFHACMLKRSIYHNKFQSLYSKYFCKDFKDLQMDRYKVIRKKGNRRTQLIFVNWLYSINWSKL